VSELVRFMKVHNMPTTAFAVGKIRVLIVDANDGQVSVLADTLREKAGYEVETVHSNFETGLAAHRFAPHVLLINLHAEGVSAMEICRHVRSSEELQTIKLIALANHLGESEVSALLQNGFDGYVSSSADPSEIVKKIEHTTAIVY